MYSITVKGRGGARGGAAACFAPNTTLFVTRTSHLLPYVFTNENYHASSPSGEARDPASQPSCSGLATGPHPRLTAQGSLEASRRTAVSL
ncbi:MAG: hypothetical protein WA021_00875 [Minisyncoccia bacterium]